MRLYIKLVGMIVLALAANQYAVSGVRRHAAWFTIRCGYADVVGDERMQERLVEEGANYVREHGQWEGDEQPLVCAARAGVRGGAAIEADVEVAPEVLCSVAR